MHKLSAKTLLFAVGIAVLVFAAFFAGGIALSSARAASANVSKGNVQSPCDKKDSQCKGDYQGASSNQTKDVVTINSVAGNRILATTLEPLDKKGSAMTIITTASTVYKPDQGIVAAGKTIFVAGTVNSDGSVTAQILGSYDPTAADFGGVITGLNGSTITVQSKDSTHIIVLTTSTTFLKLQPATKETQPASRNDLKVGETIDAQGKLNSDGSLTASTVAIVLAGAGEK